MAQNVREFSISLRESLSRLHAGSSAYLQIQGYEPAANSKAALERATYARPESLQTVSALFATLIEMVGDHVAAFEKLLVEPVATFACWTCVRSMMESAAIAGWLYDPAVDAQTRVGRSFALRYEGMEQEGKCINAFKLPATKKTQLFDHIDQTAQIALGLGFAPLVDQKGRRTGIGQHMPPATDIIGAVLQAEGAYRILSAVAHGHFWAMHQLGFRPQANNSQIQVGGVLMHAMEKHGGTLEGTAYLGMLAIKSMALPIWYQCLYFGWPQEPLVALLESVYDLLQALHSVRFWRAST